MDNNFVEDRGNQVLESEQSCANCNVQDCNFRNLPFNKDNIPEEKSACDYQIVKTLTGATKELPTFPEDVHPPSSKDETMLVKLLRYAFIIYIMHGYLGFYPLLLQEYGEKSMVNKLKAILKSTCWPFYYRLKYLNSSSEDKRYDGIVTALYFGIIYSENLPDDLKQELDVIIKNNRTWYSSLTLSKQEFVRSKAQKYKTYIVNTAVRSFVAIFGANDMPPKHFDIPSKRKLVNLEVEFYKDSGFKSLRDYISRDNMEMGLSDLVKSLPNKDNSNLTYLTSMKIAAEKKDYESLGALFKLKELTYNNRGEALLKSLFQAP